MSSKCQNLSNVKRDRIFQLKSLEITLLSPFGVALRFSRVENLRHSADSLGPPVAEEQPLSHLDVLGVPDEPEDDRRSVVAPDALDRVDSLDYSSLTNVADVDGGPEAAVNLCRVEQHVDLGLEKKIDSEYVSHDVHLLCTTARHCSVF